MKYLEHLKILRTLATLSLALISFGASAHYENRAQGSVAPDTDLVSSSGEVKKQVVSSESGKIKMKDQYLHLEAEYYIPTQLFRTDHRFVAQPVIVNTTKGTEIKMRPVVIDGAKYKLIQNRWLNFGSTDDPLSPFVIENTISQSDNSVVYRDSVLIDNALNTKEDSYYSKCYLAIVSYREPPIFVDTMRVARGLVDPARHFDYFERPMLLDQTILPQGQEPYLIPTGLDTIYIPQFEYKMESAQGEANIEFLISRATIDQNNPQNQKELSKIGEQIREIERNENATIKSISLCGYSSPDGYFEKNKKLAQARTDEVSKFITSKISAELLQSVDLNTSSVVEPWDRVADFAEEEYPELSEKIRSIVSLAHGDYDEATPCVVLLPEYRSVIVRNKYLNRLRRVTYNIEYSLYKPLGYTEIKQKYLAGDPLSRYEYYTLITGEQDPSLTPAMEQQALEAFPDFMIFANRKAVNMIRDDKYDLRVLQPLVDREAPLPILYNQTLMAISNDSMLLVDALTSLVADLPEAEYLNNAVKVAQGDYIGAYPFFEGTNSFNEAVILLALERDDEAFELICQLVESQSELKAKHYYIYAIAASRTGNVEIAMDALQQALEMDPEYHSIAQGDGDLIDIYEMLEEYKPELKNNEK